MNALPKKLSVFIGSPKEGLENVRNGVIEALLHAGHIPSGTELWAAGHVPTLEGIESHLKGCDLHVIILGTRYGSRVKGELSFTEWEFEKSIKAGRPVIPFLLAEREFNEFFHPKVKLATNKPATKTKGKEEKALREFREKLQEKSICKYFVSSDFHKSNYQRISIDVMKEKEVGFHLTNSINQAIK